jgi:hypothetical protein
VCKSSDIGLFCELSKLIVANTTKDADIFTARENHHVAYWPDRDVALVSFGKTYQGNVKEIDSNIFIYDFKLAELNASNGTYRSPWSLLNSRNDPPPARYSHYSFIDAGSYYIVGLFQGLLLTSRRNFTSQYHD